METMMFWIAIINLLLTIGLSLLAMFFAYWWSSHRNMFPWEIARKHQKNVVGKDLCPKCASNKIEFIPEAATGSQGDISYAGWDSGKCQKCGYEWDTGKSHFKGDKNKR